MQRISILGDSISTFPDCNLGSNWVHYDESIQRQSGVRSMADTWFMQVIRGLGGVLEANDSSSNSTVSGPRRDAGCTDLRTSRLGRPDRILIYLGTNDWGYSVAPGAGRPDDPNTFLGGYRAMLKKLRANYPAAEIWCGTLLDAMPPEDEDWFFNAEAHLPVAVYNDLIRRAAAEFGCRVAELDGTFSTVDGTHPDKAGMTMLAELWLRAMAAR